VNPYFRTSDYRELLESKGIEVIAPVFGHTNLDIPSLPASMYSIFDSKDMVIVDVGGDDVGSTVLGRFRPKFEGLDYDMLYVVNRFRNLTATPEEAVEVLEEIKAVSGLKPTALVNNSHLMQETDEKVISEGIVFTKKISELTGLEIKCNTMRRDLYDAGLAQNFPTDLFYPIDMYVKVCW
ncbi:MAG: ParA family protein, partial [Lachnospiraceae bacterium]|nr:ParA family protein [Lachnospiraceae bacterium]